MMAYFKALGKFIDECGFTHVMIEGGGRPQRFLSEALFMEII